MGLSLSLRTTLLATDYLSALSCKGNFPHQFWLTQFTVAFGFGCRGNGQALISVLPRLDRYDVVLTEMVP
jgi:hypothetical protein